MRSVYVVGTGMTRFGKFPEYSLKDLTGKAVADALLDGQLTANEVQSAFVGNAVAGLMTGQEMVRGRVMLAETGLAGIPIFSVENACASSSSAFHLAWMAVASGVNDVAIAVGAEKLTDDDRTRAFRAISTAVDLEAEQEVAAQVAGGPIERSYFMDLYAAKAAEYRERTSATVEDFARVVVKAHAAAADNPKAQYRDLVSLEEVLGARSIAGDLTLLMCSAVGDGAAAAVVMASEVLEKLSIGQRSRAVRVAASTLRTSDGSGSHSENATVRASRAAYELSGLAPEDIDLAEVHDAAAPAELEIYEDLGFAPAGGGVQLIRDGSTGIGGNLPVNSSGGLICRGHPIGATGLAQIVEVVEQLQGRSGSRQVPEARVALTHNAGGWIEDDNAVVAVHLFEKF